MTQDIATVKNKKKRKKKKKKEKRKRKSIKKLLAHYIYHIY